MNKSQEIAKIDSLISHLGKESYLGQSIADQREQIIADIRSDIMPLQFSSLRAIHSEKLAEIEKQSATIAKLKEEVETLAATERRLSISIAKAKETAREIAARLHYAVS